MSAVVLRSQSLDSAHFAVYCAIQDAFKAQENLKNAPKELQNLVDALLQEEPANDNSDPFFLEQQEQPMSPISLFLRSTFPLLQFSHKMAKRKIAVFTSARDLMRTQDRIPLGYRSFGTIIAVAQNTITIKETTLRFHTRDILFKWDGVGFCNSHDMYDFDFKTLYHSDFEMWESLLNLNKFASRVRNATNMIGQFTMDYSSDRRIWFVGRTRERKTLTHLSVNLAERTVELLEFFLLRNWPRDLTNLLFEFLP